MSYCRWSSDDFQSHVYVYADVSGGWTIHVASTKVLAAKETRPPSIGDWQKREEQGVKEFIARQQAVVDWLNSGERKPIGLPYDGATFNLPTPQDAAHKLQELKDLGYNVPDGVIETLMEE